MRTFAQWLLRLAVTCFGSDLVDHRTGEKIGRAVLICWRGRLYFLGYEGSDQVMPVFLPQKRVSFWKREMGFTVHPRPDFPREREGTDGREN